MSSHCRDVDEDPVAGVEVELGWTLDHQSGHIRRKDHPCLDHRRPASKVDVHRPKCLVEQPNDEPDEYKALLECMPVKAKAPAHPPIPASEYFADEALL